MTLDDPDAIRRFISRIKHQPDDSDSNSATSPPTTQLDRPANEHHPSTEAVESKHIDDNGESSDAKTPPRAIMVAPDNNHLASPEAHPKPSPHVSGLKAPFNTPKTAASSPRLVAANTHNEDVAEAISDNVDTVNSHHLSESMWAPGSGRYKPSTLSGARSTNVLMPVKAVEPNPAINDIFDRMTFKAADQDPKVGENLIGDHVTRYMSSKPLPSFIKQSPDFGDKAKGGKVDLVHTTLEKARDENLEPAAETGTAKNAQKPHFKTDRVDEENLPDLSSEHGIRKENDAPSTAKVHLLPHLRATQASRHESFKAESKKVCSEVLGPDVTGKITNPGSIEDAVRTATAGDEPKVTTVPVATKPMTYPSSNNEDLEHKTFFNAWPALEERTGPAAKVRKVIIKELPRDSTATFVASIVYGGPIEEIQIRSSAAGHLSAVVRFMDAGDCMRFYEETSNGLVYQKDKGRELVVFVELSKDVDVVGGLLQGWIASGVTRCVRAVGVESKWDLDGLLKIAERKNRKVEKIVDGQNAGGARSVVFRFCKIDDAVSFKAALSRDEDWEQCNIHYAADPCATASGIHMEN